MNVVSVRDCPPTAGRVSVIVPARNRPEQLNEAVKSVASQTYADVELIVIDDGSETPLEGRVRDVWTKTRSLEDLIVRRISASNGNRARNAGLELASGEFIQFLDSDDILNPDKLTYQVASLERAPDLDGIICQVEYFDGAGRSGLWLSKLKYGLPTVIDFFEGSCDWQTMAPLWRRDLFETGLCWDPEICCLQDWLFHLQALANGARLLLDLKILAYYRLPEEGNVSWNMLDPVKLRQRIVVCRRAMDVLARVDALDARTYRLLWARLEQIKCDSIGQRDFGAYFRALGGQFRGDPTLRGRIRTIASFLKNSWLLAKLSLRGPLSKASAVVKASGIAQ